jgi:DNA invertase Pin-like site-specific DNA recombinase
MLQARIHAGLKRAVAGGRKLGRPLNDPDAIARARDELAKGIGINRVAKQVGLSNGTVQRIKGEMEAAVGAIDGVIGQPACG